MIAASWSSFSFSKLSPLRACRRPECRARLCPLLSGPDHSPRNPICLTRSYIDLARCVYVVAFILSRESNGFASRLVGPLLTCSSSIHCKNAEHARLLLARPTLPLWGHEEDSVSWPTAVIPVTFSQPGERNSPGLFDGCDHSHAGVL